MGNSTVTLQQVVDSVAAIGDLNPVLISTGGYSSEPAVTIANDVMEDLMCERFPWKWNRMKYPVFALVSRQQDYASLTVKNLGWLENGYRVQANTTIIPPPTWPIEVVRDLNVSRVSAGWPAKAAWYPNDQLEQGDWPGPNYEYENPIGPPVTPNNANTNITDSAGNILVLTTWGVTGSVKPEAPAWKGPGPQPDTWPIGQVIQDGTVQWTVADPSMQGIRLWPPPPDASGATWIMRLFAQKSAPHLTSLQDKMDPIPDAEMKYFRDGFIAYAHRYSSVPSVKARYPQMKAEWLEALVSVAKANNREDEGRGFYPTQGILNPEYYSDPGPGNPYWRQWGGS